MYPNVPHFTDIFLPANSLLADQAGLGVRLPNPSSVPPPDIKPLDIRKQYVYSSPMIQTFASSETEHFFATGKSRRLPPEILKRAAMRLTQLDGAICLDDLRIPSSNSPEALARDRAGQWSIRINDQWRVCFRFENGDAYEVEIVDYH